MMGFLKFSLLVILSFSFMGQKLFAADVAYTEDNCIDGQDLNAADIDISHCPVLPTDPTTVALGTTGQVIDLGAWEIGQTAEGQAYKYGSLSEPNGAEPRVLTFEGGTTVVN